MEKSALASLAFHSIKLMDLASAPSKRHRSWKTESSDVDERPKIEFEKIRSKMATAFQTTASPNPTEKEDKEKFTAAIFLI